MTATSLIEPGFMFSQHSLNTYVQCPRRFLLKYVDRQPWPVPEDKDPRSYQEHLARGRLFHQWLVRRQLGLDMATIVAGCSDAQLLRWWRAAESFGWHRLPASRQPELPVVVPIGDYRLYARYDLIAWEPDAAVIVDWKTLPVRLEDRILRARMQTRVYLYTLVRAGHVALGSPAFRPEQITMQYWFSEFPQAPATIEYGPTDLQSDADRLLELTERIASQPREAFLATERQAVCARCNYRSWCHASQPEARAAAADWQDEDLDFSLDVETAPELDY